jgi:hypothetical protein
MKLGVESEPKTETKQRIDLESTTEKMERRFGAKLEGIPERQSTTRQGVMSGTRHGTKTGIEPGAKSVIALQTEPQIKPRKKHGTKSQRKPKQ